MLSDLENIEPSLRLLFKEKLYSVEYSKKEKPYLSVTQFWDQMRKNHQDRVLSAQSPFILEDVMLMGRKIYQLLSIFEATSAKVHGLVIASHYHTSRPELDIIRPQAPEFASNMLKHLHVTD